MADNARTVRGLIVSSLPARGRIMRFALLTLAVAAVCGAVIFVGGRSEPAVSAIPAVPVPMAASGSGRNGPDGLLVKTMREINANRLDGALAHSQPLETSKGVPLDQIEDLREEARVRIARYERRPPRHACAPLPGAVDARAAARVRRRYVDRDALCVFRNQDGGLRYVDDFYVSIGKNGINKVREGDNRTPLGVYHVTKWMPRAQLVSEYGKQSELYGVGALPLNYPNAWDRREGREGHGIWLHGVPFDTYSRPPRSSNGCVALTNEDFETLTGRVQIGLTPVVITNGIEWVAPDVVTTVRLELTDQLERWRRDWESLDTEKYLHHYAAAFSSGRSGLREWSAHKRRVNSGKKWAKVNLDKVSIVLYPGRDDLAVITFRQDYKSSNLKSRMLKRQYWMKDGGSWRILYEGSA